MVHTRLTQRSSAERHNTFGKEMGSKEMENQQEAMNTMMMMMFERMLQEQRAMSKIVGVVKRFVQ